MSGSPFKLTDLPNNTWAVSWPGHENTLINNLGKCQRLLKILFDVVEVDVAKVGVSEGSKEELFTVEIPLGTWLQDPEGCAHHLANYSIPGCVFDTLSSAEKFKLHLEQRLVWSRLSNQKPWDESNES